MSRTISRRTFLKGAAVVGVSLTAGGCLPWNGNNIPEKVKNDEVIYDVLVIGSGGAGMRAALAAAEDKKLKVAVMTKLMPTRSASTMAQGGMNGVTLSFTCSCRSSICGACAVRVNGNAELSCEVLVENLLKRYNTNTLTIKPLGNFRVIRDLIVDWDPKYARIKKIKPAMEPKQEFSLEKGCKQTPEEFNRFKKFAGCILCGSCVSECNKNSLNDEDFLDPFIFVKAEKLVADSRNRTPEEHLKAVQEAGLWRCFNCQECTAKCPKGLDPAGAIEKLKEATFRYGLKQGVGGNHAKAIYNDISDSGMLDESKLNIKSEGLLAAGLRFPMAIRLARTGKMNPLASHPTNPEIKTIQAIVKNAEKEALS